MNPREHRFDPHGSRKNGAPAGVATRSRRNRPPWTAAAGFLLALALSHAAVPASSEVRIDAEFDPALVPLGQRTNYIITIEGNDDPIRGNPPRIHGLEISTSPVRSVESETRIIQGRTHSTHRVRYSFRTRPVSTGTFTVPAWEASIAGETVRVPAAELQVVEPGEELRDAFLLLLEPEIDTIYVGESRPVELVLLLRDDVRAQPRSWPRKSGDAFLDPDFRQEPSVERVRYRNRTYNAVRWPFLLAPIKAGESRISFSIDIAALSREDGISGRARDPFDRAFGRSLFRRQSVEERTVRSEALSIHVREPPESGRPESFQGAIGTFTASHRLSTQTSRVGEPLSLTLTITGSGNFSRIPPPELESDDHWQVYPPRTEFAPEDEIGHHGTLEIEYIIVPRHPGITHAPSIAFSYLNPETGRYDAAELEPIEVTVQASETIATHAATADGMVEDDSTLYGPQLLAKRWYSPDRSTGYRTAWFYLAHGVPILLLIVLTIWRRRQNRLNEDARFARRVSGSRAVRTNLRKARLAIGRSDVPAFFTHARAAIQHSLLRHIPMEQRPESLTWTEVSEHLLDREAAESLRHEVRTIFEFADALRFGDANTPVAVNDLPRWEHRLVALVRELEKTQPRHRNRFPKTQ